jgi:hypothetical protein
MHPLPTVLLLRRVGRHVPALAAIHGIISGEAPVAAHRIDRFVAVSPYIRDFLVETERLLPGDVVVVPNGIDVVHYDAPPLTGLTLPTRVLWASTYLPLRHEALVSLAAAVVTRDDVRLTVVQDRLPNDLLPEDERITVIPKGRDLKELIAEHDAVAALGPGRFLLEGMAMNRAGLCLSGGGLAEWVGAENIAKLEYYLGDWGEPVAPLLEPELMRAHQNRREIVTENYDSAANVAKLVRELETLQRRTNAPLYYRLKTLRRLPAIARDYALIPWLKRRLRVAPFKPLLGR